ncbi:MAG: response regulator [Bacillota bacterium]
MYKILLVDDEDEVRENMVSLVDWASLGFSVIAQARNGKEALEKVEYFLPDVVFTDIRMPYMDGMELIEELHKHYPSIKIIIFSGHEEFTYAKKALYYNVLDYILKPVNLKELEEIFRGVYQKLEKEIAELKDFESLEKKFEINLPVLRQKYYQDLIRGTMTELIAQQMLEEYRIKTLYGRRFLCFKANVHCDPTVEKKELVQLSVRDLLEKSLLERNPNHKGGVIFLASDRICGILVDIEDISGLLELLLDVCKEVKKIFSAEMFIGVGNPHDGLRGVRASAKEAGSALNYQYFQDVNQVIYINDIKSVKEDDIPLEQSYEALVFQIMREKNEDKMEELVDGIGEEFSKHNLSENKRHVYAMHIFTTMLRIFAKYEINVEQILPEDTNFLEFVEHISNEGAMKTWLTKSLREVKLLLVDDELTKNSDIVKKAKRFIIENYWDSNLSLDTVCGHLHISPTYFSAVFKRETGENFVSFVTKTRIEQAIILLNTTELKAIAISEKVGFNEPNYFNYVFKRYMGMTPSKFKNKG